MENASGQGRPITSSRYSLLPLSLFLFLKHTRMLGHLHLNTNCRLFVSFEVAHATTWYAGKERVRLLKVQDSGLSASAIPVGIGFGRMISLLSFHV